jgi:hypothetical protein
MANEKPETKYQELDIKYQELADAIANRTDLDHQINNLIRYCDDTRKEIKEQDETGEYGLVLTAHAISQILTRLEELADENSVIKKDVENRDNPQTSLIRPSNMRSFIFGILAKARIDKNYEIVNSKNSGGKECHYNVELKSWSTDSKRLIFTGVVENNNIKTGYFNWVS